MKPPIVASVLWPSGVLVAVACAQGGGTPRFVSPSGGDEHATVLVPQDAAEVAQP